MIKIVIVPPEWNTNDINCTQEEIYKIREWFITRSFVITFVPQVGMKIDLDDFFNPEDELSNLELELLYPVITEVVIGKNDITIYCD
jgi:hypothetical protein